MEAVQPDTGQIRVPTQLRAETIAYALQSGVCNIAANFFEPYIGYQIQKRNHGAAEKYGSYTQNLGGEFAGDLIGSGSLILAETICPNELHAGLKQARKLVDPLYASAAHIVLAKEKNSPDYQQKVDKWKTFQERNLVRSGLMAITGIAGNIATQKLLLENPSPTGLIFKGKLLSTAVTTGIGLCSRLVFPKQMGALDKWIGKEIVPLIETEAETAAKATHARKLADAREHAPQLKPAL